MSFFERLFSLKWYFYVFTVGMVLGILSIIIQIPNFLEPSRFLTSIIELFIFISGVITFPWIQLAWHGRFSHFTMMWLKNFGRDRVNTRGLERDEVTNEYAIHITKNIFIAVLKLLEDVLIFFFGFIIIFFVLNKAFAKAYQYGYLKPKYQEQDFKNLVDIAN